eukprot:2535009-Pyramimonas_sp.AAC.1
MLRRGSATAPVRAASPRCATLPRTRRRGVARAVVERRERVRLRRRVVRIEAEVRKVKTP